MALVSRQLPWGNINCLVEQQTTFPPFNLHDIIMLNNCPTINREIFVAKIFSQSVLATKNTHTKIKHMCIHNFTVHGKRSVIYSIYISSSCECMVECQPFSNTMNMLVSTSQNDESDKVLHMQKSNDLTYYVRYGTINHDIHC